ncbi:tRNA lysidine(34) synthetase TilS [Govanella unica]|uniref:tRNA(Ile)-lysidine synthase n=1 Tax=Govanella unica TaxID=2975056 RepID=A0A9X3U1T0_9PROT|nr:tRNA lysidine(34) synthetase TilS [Govania unica]MDA5194919.1 tRNA lysidine(34) synthetase TilS [Govania unica]
MSLSDDDFARLMAPLGPFETAPRLAVALSGGADSMALVLLADAWARARGGMVLALTVDHGLRADSAAEAAGVAARMAALGIAHETLVWSGEKPRRGVQMRAREARYELMLGACRARGILHLLVGHHAGDQAETVAIRAERGSGTAGLQGMTAISPPPLPGPRWPRLLRPLLTVPKVALEAYLRARGEDWIEDPSNHNPAYARVRVRQGMDEVEAARWRVAADAAREAATLEARDLGPLLVRDVVLHPAGFAQLAAPPFLDPELRRAAWQAVLMTVGGLTYPPRGEDLDRLMARVTRLDFRGATLGGCRIETGVGRWRVLREEALADEQTAFQDGMMWDGRFRLSGDAEGLVVRRFAGGDIPGLPAAVRRSLPGLWDGDRCLGLPVMDGVAIPENLLRRGIFACFQPARALFY